MKYAFFAVLCSVCCVVTAAEQTTHKDYRKGESKSFFDNKREGWFWFQEESDEPIKKKIPTPQEPIVILAPAQESETAYTQPETKTVVINAAWLRENLPELKETAINNPSDENLKAYFYAQRMTIDLSSRFASRTKEFFMAEPELDENNRRPTAGFVLTDHKKNISKSKKSLLKSIFKKAGIWMFVRADCSFCQKQIPVMDELTRSFGSEVLYVSIDGETVRGHSDDGNYVYDVTGTARERIGLDVDVTPTIIFVRNDGSDAILINKGMIDMYTLTEKILVIAKNTNLITETEYMLTQDVRAISALKDDTPMTVEVNGASADEEKDVTKLLVEKIKKKLKNSIHSSATTIKD
jgi:conjugal transfer pilus assembly protein TraF